ncbi:hypothetical protein FPV67DRAFT_995485 [Lyophyllum atratum]|nr:hypothetical protein FPV67DRAFT_995485 [Lyophyllum atratum]
MAQNTTPPPPAYDENTQSFGLPAALNAGTAIGNSQATIMQEIRQLAVGMQRMDNTFQRVKGELASLNPEGDANPTISKVQTHWTSFHERFTELLWLSRNSATQTESYLRDFVQVILPSVVDYEASTAEKQGDLQEFIYRINPNVAAPGGGTASQAFTNLELDVQLFASQSVVPALGQLARLTAEVETLTKEVDALNGKLKHYYKILKQMPYALGATVTVVTLGVAATLAAPFIVAGILVTGIGAATAEVTQIVLNIERTKDVSPKSKEVQRRIDQVKKEIQTLGSAHALEKVNSILNSELQQHSQSISAYLDNFTRIWNMASHDAAILKEADLEHIEDNEALLLRIEHLTDRYKTLAGCLAEYATTVERPE